MANSYHSWRTGIQIDNIYPVGAIYMSVNSTNPGSLFGGTWELILDKFLLCCGSTYTAGTTGGAATVAHTHPQVAVTTGASSAANSGGPSTTNTGGTSLSVANLPSHRHGWSRTVLMYGTVSLSDGSITTALMKMNAGNSEGGIFSDRFSSDSYKGGTSYTGSGTAHSHTLNSHTHTIAHTHSIDATTTGAASNTNNMPPYLAVYVFKRIS